MMIRIPLLFVAALASAQVRINPSFRTDGPITINVTPGAGSSTAITGLPYSGERTSERILSDGTQMSQSMVREFRDSLGRLREEHSGQGFGPLTIVEILDPVAGLDWVLDPVNQAAYRMVLQPKSRAASRNFPPCEPGGPPTTKTMPNGNVSTRQQLGTEKIQGIEACGSRTTIAGKDGTAGSTFETWFSREDIGGVLLDKISNPQGDRSISQLVNVSFTEPDPELFVPPASYRVVDETTTFTITGPAPVPQTSEGLPAPASRTTIALTGLPWSGDLMMNGGTLLGRQFRDSMGRTRRDGNGTDVTIVDPVSGYSYTLNTAAQTAHRRSITVQSKPATDATAPPAAGSQTRKLPSGVIALNESLGTKTIDGVATFGTRVTLTYPPGTIGGNDKTTSSVTESWFSPQLGAALLTQSSGAVVPNTASSLTNLKYSEPDPSLLKVPDGYQVIDDH